MKQSKTTFQIGMYWLGLSIAIALGSLSNALYAYTYIMPSTAVEITDPGGGARIEWDVDFGDLHEDEAGMAYADLYNGRWFTYSGWLASLGTGAGEGAPIQIYINTYVDSERKWAKSIELFVHHALENLTINSVPVDFQAIYNAGLYNIEYDVDFATAKTLNLRFTFQGVEYEVVLTKPANSHSMTLSAWKPIIQVEANASSPFHLLILLMILGVMGFSVQRYLHRS